MALTRSYKETVLERLKKEPAFKRLAEETGVSEKSLHRMLGQNGNPTIQNIGKILHAIQQDLGYVPQVTVSAA